MQEITSGWHQSPFAPPTRMDVGGRRSARLRCVCVCAVSVCVEKRSAVVASGPLPRALLLKVPGTNVGHDRRLVGAAQRALPPLLGGFRVSGANL